MRGSVPGSGGRACWCWRARPRKVEREPVLGPRALCPPRSVDLTARGRDGLNVTEDPEQLVRTWTGLHPLRVILRS